MNDFKDVQHLDKVELDHLSAIKAAKISKRLVKKTVKLVNTNKPEATFASFGLSTNRTDPESVTLALNSELQGRGINASALVEKRWNGSIGDPMFSNILRLIELEDDQVSTSDQSKS